LYREINYGKHNECGLVLIVDLVFILFKQTITVTSIKYRLIEIYNSLMVTKDMAKNIGKILDIERQSKRAVGL